jgi:hypothetical protein
MIQPYYSYAEQQAAIRIIQHLTLKEYEVGLSDNEAEEFDIYKQRLELTFKNNATATAEAIVYLKNYKNA